LASPICAGLCSRLLFVTATAELILTGVENKCASEVQLMLQVGQECQSVCAAIINNNATADLQNRINTMHDFGSRH